MPYFHSPVTMPEKPQVQIKSQEHNYQWDIVPENDSLQKDNCAEYAESVETLTVFPSLNRADLTHIIASHYFPVLQKAIHNNELSVQITAELLSVQVTVAYITDFSPNLTPSFQE